MRKRTFAILALVGFMVAAFCEAALAVSEPWDGTIGALPASVGNVYTITTPQQLAALAKAVNDGESFSGKTFKLGNDIDLNNYEWTPIGIGMSILLGDFDGNGHAVEGLKISRAHLRNGFVRIGFFAATNNEIKNLTVKGAITLNINDTGEPVVNVEIAGIAASAENLKGCVSDIDITVQCNVQPSSYYPLIAGIATSAESITNCKNFGNIIYGSDWCADIAGIVCNSGGTLDNCVNSGAIRAAARQGRVGGIAGSIFGNTISRCTNTGDIDFYGDEGSAIGGIVGYVSGQSPKIIGCENSGRITDRKEAHVGSVSDAGGIVGKSSPSDAIYINACTNSGTVTVFDNTDAGGIMAEGIGRILNCLNTGTISNNGESGSVAGIVASYGGIYLENIYSIVNCVNTGNIKGNSQYRAGGIVASISGQNIISNCTVIGNIETAGATVGGIAGDAANEAVIRKCAFIGNLRAATPHSNSIGSIAGATDTDYQNPAQKLVIVGCIWQVTNNATIRALGYGEGTISNSEVCTDLRSAPIISILIGGYRGVSVVGESTPVSAIQYPVSDEAVASYLWQAGDDKILFDDTQSKTARIKALSEGDSSFSVNITTAASHNAEMNYPLIILKDSTAPISDPDPEPITAPAGGGSGGGCSAGFGVLGLLAVFGLASMRKYKSDKQ